MNHISTSNVGVRAQRPTPSAVLASAPTVSRSASEMPQGPTEARLAPSRIPLDTSGASAAPATSMLQRRPSQVPAVLIRGDSPEAYEKTFPVHDVVGKGGGQPLIPKVRADMEASLGGDFSDVRIHTDTKAAASATSVSAEAYTVGNEIVFGPGFFAPDSPAGKHRLAHELSHVQQQRKGPVSGADTGSGVVVSDPSDSFEQEAETIASRVFASSQAVTGNRVLPGAEAAHVVRQQAGQSALQRQPMVFPEDVISVVPTVEMPAEHISGSPGQYTSQIIETAHNVSNRARINAVQFATQVESACAAFKVYAEPKIKELAGEVTASDLAVGLASAVLAAVGGSLAAKIANTFAKQIVTQISRQLAKGLTDQAKSASPGSKDIKDLSNAVDSIAMGARDSATGIEDAVGGTIDVVVNEIINRVNTGIALSSEQEDFIGPFYSAPQDVTDTFLESYGIPSGASASKMQLEVYQGLVEKFEEKLIWTHASFKEKLEMGFARDFGATELTLAYKAGQVAQQARKAREDELKTTR